MCLAEAEEMNETFTMLNARIFVGGWISSDKILSCQHSEHISRTETISSHRKLDMNLVLNIQIQHLFDHKSALHWSEMLWSRKICLSLITLTADYATHHINMKLLISD